MPRICTAPKYCASSEAAANAKILSGKFDGGALNVSPRQSVKQDNRQNVARVVAHKAALYADRDVNFYR